MNHDTSNPTPYNEDVAELICQRIASGESLSDICSDAAMPAYTTFYHWLHKYPALGRQYAMAVICRTETYAEQIVAIADAAVGGDSETISVAKIRIAVRQWLLARLIPQRYGERVTIATDSSGNPYGMRGQDTQLIEDASSAALVILDQIADAKATLQSASETEKTVDA